MQIGQVSGGVASSPFSVPQVSQMNFMRGMMRLPVSEWLMRRLAALLAAVLLAGCSGEADFSGAIETEILPAEEYQQEIAAIDRLLFREEPIGEEGARELERIVEGLATRVRAHGDTKFIQLETLELKLLAKRAGRLSPDGTGKALQNDWMRLRNNLFDDRAWFVRSAADLEYAASVVPPPREETTVKPRLIAPAPVPQTVQRAELTGAWRVESITADGKPRQDEELTGSVWTFDAPRLVMQPGAGPQTVFNFTPEGEFLHVTGASGEDGWMRYELTSGGLRVAFYDGLGAKPPGFEPDPKGGGKLLLVVRLSAQ
jgi:hypothetical protein